MHRSPLHPHFIHTPSAGLSLAEVMSAGLFVSGTMLLLGATRLMDLFNAAVPPSIVRGIQLAVGLALAKKVRASGTGSAFFPHSKQSHSLFHVLRDRSYTWTQSPYPCCMIPHLTH